MTFRYLDGRGKVVYLADVAAFIDAIRRGAITADTPLALGTRDSFQPAGTVTAFQHARIAASRPPEFRPPYAIPPWYRRRNVQLVALVLSALLLVYLATLRLRTLEHKTAVAQQRSVTEANARTGAEALRLTTEFGDSAALAQRRVQNWVDQQRFGDRLRGSALQSVGSLHGVRTASNSYGMAVDSLLARSRSFAAALVQRADSLESAGPELVGLLARVEDDLAVWQRDLAAWAELQHGTAATLDSLAAFMLDRQQSFALRDGQLTFLSRSDGARFRELGEALTTLSNREASWAEAVRLKHSGWMEALPADARPRFGRTPDNAP